MRTKLILTLTDAAAIAAAAEEYAESRELRVAIAVVDESTYVQHVIRMDGAPLEGGVPVIVDGQCVDAIGVAGVLPHLDAAIADAGQKSARPF